MSLRGDVGRPGARRGLRRIREQSGPGQRHPRLELRQRRQHEQRRHQRFRLYRHTPRGRHGRLPVRRVRGVLCDRRRRRRGNGRQNPHVLVRRHDQRVPDRGARRCMHQRAGLRRWTAMLLSAERECAQRDECDRVRGIVSGGSSSDLHDERRLRDGQHVRATVRRRLWFHDLSRGARLHEHRRLCDGPGVLRRRLRRGEFLPNRHDMPCRAPPNLRSR
jgi:hypothetical protein